MILPVASFLFSWFISVEHTCSTVTNSNMDRTEQKCGSTALLQQTTVLLVLFSLSRHTGRPLLSVNNTGCCEWTITSSHTNMNGVNGKTQADESGCCSLDTLTRSDAPWWEWTSSQLVLYHISCSDNRNKAFKEHIQCSNLQDWHSHQKSLHFFCHLQGGWMTFYSGLFWLHCNFCLTVFTSGHNTCVLSVLVRLQPGLQQPDMDVNTFNSYV